MSLLLLHARFKRVNKLSRGTARLFVLRGRPPQRQRIEFFGRHFDSFRFRQSRHYGKVFLRVGRGIKQRQPETRRKRNFFLHGIGAVYGRRG